MAGTGNTSSYATTMSEAGQSTRGAARGRGRGTGRGGPQSSSMGLPSERGENRSRVGNERGRSRGRAHRGRGRGGGPRDRAASQSQPTSPIIDEQPSTEQPPPQPGGLFGDRLTKEAESSEKDESKDDSQPDGGERDTCFICASEVIHWAVSPCNHRSCHVCALRWRALYKSKACAHCRTEAATVVFTKDGEKRYEEYSENDFYRKDDNMGIAFETEQIWNDTVFFLRYNCPDPDCQEACLGWPHLHRHVRNVHHKHMCDLCTRNKKVFTHEHELFTQQELRKHEKFGDDNPGAVDQSGFKGHPECGFCRKRFYGEDELYIHCRDNHERCHLCDRRTGGLNPHYYLDYNALEQHFNKDHFPCYEKECQEKKFVVFDSEMDLKAHQLESHPNSMSKDVRRDAMRVDISSFDYRPQYQEVRRGGGRRGGARGRDPNSEPMVATSGGHLSRAELAHQREREVHGAQYATSRTFGGQLTQAEPAQSPRPNNVQPSLAALHDRPPISTPSSPRPAEALTPQEQARRLRHAAVTERAANLLQNDQMKLTEFRERISSYRNGTITASDLIDAFFSLFDTSSAELGKLVKELADIFELPGKRDALLKAWSDWKAINEDYPSLPGPTGVNTAAGVLGSGIGGSRVLKLKSSTAPSSRAPLGRHQSWGSAAASASKPFPSLPAGSGQAPPAPTPGWLKLKPAASKSASSSTKASPVPSRTQSSANLKKTDAFPALPAAKRPTSTVFSPGYTGAGVIRNNTGAAVSAWSGVSIGSDASAFAPPAGGNDGAEMGKGKGKGRKKQVLYGWG